MLRCVCLLAIVMIGSAESLAPKVYASAEEARKAAEEELSKLGDEVESPEDVQQKAVTEALSMAKATVSDPAHSDLEGIKVNLGNSGDYAEIPKSAPVAAPVETQPAAAAPQVPVAVAQKPAVEIEVPMAKRMKKSDKAVPALSVPKQQNLVPHTAGRLLDDEAGTRPSAPQFPQFGTNGAFPGFPGMPQFGAMPQFGSMPFPQFGQLPIKSLQAPDVNQDSCSGSDCAPNTAAAPTAFSNMGQNAQVPDILRNLPLAPQQFPAMMSQLGQMLQQPQGMQAPWNMPMAQMPAQFPQMGLSSPQTMQQMPNMLNDMMKQMPMMMQQMQQSFMQQGPAVMQQIPQLMKQFPMPNMLSNPLADFQRMMSTVSKSQASDHTKM